MASILDDIAAPAKILLIGKSGCLSGDTTVIMYKGTKQREPTIKQLYEQTHGLARGPGTSNWNPNTVVYLLHDEGGYTAKGKLIEVVKSGIKPVFLVTADGETIKATADHLFKTITGFVPLKDLVPGLSLVFLWDRQRLGGRRKVKVERERKVTYSIPYHPFAMANVVAGKDYKRTHTARLVVEAAINGMELEELIEILRKDPDTAATLQYLSPEKEVHHSDGDVTNDDLGNLVVLESGEHLKEHHQDVVNASKKIPLVKIDSIIPAGEEMTYDIMMEGPHHNFIANKFVVHNSGKTGSLASLVASGYNLRIIDTDKGVRTLRSLLLDPRYPYANLIKAKNIDLAQAVRYVPVDTEMSLRTVITKIPGEGNRTKSETLLAPKDAKAWTTAVDLLDKWKEGGIDLGSVRSWGLQDVLVLDSFSTLAKCAYYFSQAMNSRLGARDQGRDYQRDVGEAQSQLTRLLELLYDSSIKCNVIVISHVTWVDESQGVASRPREASADGSIVLSNPDGYPSAIGRALSPHIGKYFNDAYIARSSGTGMAVRRTISTVPQDGVLAKNSVFLEREYPVSYGLADIFAALRSQPRPTDVIEACEGKRPQVGQKPPTSAVA